LFKVSSVSEKSIVDNEVLELYIWEESEFQTIDKKRGNMNIELHGFDQNVAGRLIDEILMKLIHHFGSDFVVNVVPVTTIDMHNRSAQFFRVYSDQKEHFQTVVGLLREVRVPGAKGARIFVECILLHYRLCL
jgi:hypothetical protein